MRSAIGFTTILASISDFTYHNRMSTNQTLIQDIILGISRSVCRHIIISIESDLVKVELVDSEALNNQNLLKSSKEHYTGYIFLN